MKSLAVLVALLLLTLHPISTQAQSFDDPWSEPLNLSNSGAATNPTMVEDSTGIIHVFWWDEFDGNMYMRLVGDEWSTPVPIDVPFDEFTPVLVADSGGNLHAFWTDEEQVLYYASVNADGIFNSDWNFVGILAGSAINIGVQVDEQDRLHLGYLRSADTPEAPAGFYYRQSIPGGNEWLNPVTIYRSAYLRKLTPGGAYVDVAITYSESLQYVYLAWDNLLRGQAFLVKSEDGGDSWGEPMEVDEPQEGSGDARPSHPSVYAQGEEVLLLWQTGTPETGCTQSYQWSLDGGQFWQPSQRMSGGLFGCPERTEIFNGPDGPILMQVSDQVYLQAWDGTRWSDAQLQSPLSSFVDPQSQQNVVLGCLEAALLDGQRLLVVGCGAGDIGDIWWLQRSLDDIPDWYPQESLWQSLTTVTREQAEFLSLALAADSDGRVHVLWSQSSDPTSSRPDSSLYYTRWEGEHLWFQPVAVLDFPGQPADQPDVDLGSAERLFIAWRRGEGEIYFSQASANLAALRNAWIEAERVSALGHVASAPDILANDGGEIFIAYAVPVNEGRGVYLTASSDSGLTWSPPHLVFDGAAAGWAMLDHPHLAVTGGGDLHLLWTRYSLVSGKPEPEGLAYARSPDGGLTWSEAELVAENRVLWSQVYGLEDGIVHRLWRESSGGSTTLWHDLSQDNGGTWDRVAQVSIFGDAIGDPSFTVDRAGNLHLLQVVDRGTGGNLLQHWIWDGQRWGGSDGLNLDLDLGTQIGDLISAASPHGDLAVIFSARPAEPDSDSQSELLFTSRSIELPEGLVTPLPAASVTPPVIATPTPEVIAAPTPTSTPDLSALVGAGSAGSAGGPWDGLMIGAALAGLIVAAVFGFGIWKARA